VTVVKKRPVKPKLKPKMKRGSAPARASAAAAAAATTTVTSASTTEVERNQWGYRVDSDVAVVLEEMMAGGPDKHSIAMRLAERFKEHKTKTGASKPVSTVMNQVQKHMLARGFTIESTWRLVPPADGVLKDAPRRTRKPSTKKTSGKTAPTPSGPKKLVKPKPKMLRK
jgi:hypothetical protein